MHYEFTRHVFATLTYKSQDSGYGWTNVSKHFNRFVQNYRRFHLLRVEYLRAVESHKDGRPHIHVLFQYPSACIRVHNRRYFDNTLYQKWRTLWPHGLSDYQKPHRSGISSISYILKYITKNSTSKTVWNKLYSVVNAESSPSSKNSYSTEDKSNQDASSAPIKKNGIKLLSWSRGFDWSPFYVVPTQPLKTP